MKTVGAYEAKTHLARLLEQVADGEKIVITKHGVPVALLGPFPEEKDVNPQATIASIRVLRKKLKLGGVTLKELIGEGRK